MVAGDVELKDIVAFCVLSGRRSRRGETLSDDEGVLLVELTQRLELRTSDSRRFLRTPIDLRGVLRRDLDEESVRVVDIGGGGAMVEGASYLRDGDRVDLLVEHSSGRRLHFFGRVSWVDRRRAGVEFVGVPSELAAYWQII